MELCICTYEINALRPSNIKFITAAKNIHFIYSLGHQKSKFQIHVNIFILCHIELR